MFVFFRNIYTHFFFDSLLFPNVSSEKYSIFKNSCVTIDHAEFLHQVPDDILADMLPLAKKVALASGLDASQYNLLQVINNGHVNCI